MQLTYYGHACFSVQTGGKQLLFDPFITYNELAKDIDITTIAADYILVSHGHQDHIADAVAIAKRTNAVVICAYELMAWFNKQGVNNVSPMNTGGKRSFDFGAVKCVVAQHSSQLPDGSYGANPMGFVVTTADGSFYYSGDTALTLDMQLIPRWASIAFAVLPIGDGLTMGAEDAADAAHFAETNKVVGVHYNTFDGIKIDPLEAKKTFEAKGIELLLPEIGQTINV